MERQFGDSSDVSVALADLPSDALLYRQPTSGTAQFRRPSAATPQARGAEPSPADTGSWNAFAAGGDPEPGSADGSLSSEHRPEPAFGPAPPATNGRASFGFTAGPISGHWRDGAPVSGAPDPTGAHSLPADSGAGRFDGSFAALPPGPDTFGTGRADDTFGGRPDGMFSTGRADDTFGGRPDGMFGGGRADEAFGFGRADESPYAASIQDSEQWPGGRHEQRAPEDEHIGDLVGDHGHEIRPHRAATTAAAPRRSRGVMVAGIGLTAAVLFAGTVAGVTYFSGTGGGGLTSVLELGAGDRDAADQEARTVLAPIDGRTTATFEMVSGASKVIVRSANLGDNLYRMTTTEESGMVPKPLLSANKVELSLTPEPDAADGTGEVEVTLSTKVMWNLQFTAGADEQVLNLEDGKIGGIAFAGAARSTTIQLPDADGTVPVKVTGAIDELAMTSPAGNPVRVKVKGGAQTVAAGARTLQDIAPGSTLTPKGWATKDRFDVEAESRVTLLTVGTRN